MKRSVVPSFESVTGIDQGTVSQVFKENILDDPHNLG
jgi:hypothetical protein